MMEQKCTFTDLLTDEVKVGWILTFSVDNSTALIADESGSLHKKTIESVKLEWEEEE